MFAVSVMAQLPTGTILGVVKDSSGAAVPGATLTVRNVDTDQSRNITTGQDGAYRVPALAVGHYEVKTSHTGFKTETQTGLVLDVSQELVVNFELQVGTTEQQVVVTGEAPVVNTTTSSLGGVVSEERISDLPLNGRNYITLSLLQTGVTQHANVGTTPGLGGVWFSSNGAPTRSNYFTLDGAPLVTQFGGTTSSVAGTTLGIDGIQEYKVITNTFSAEYGMTMGSQMVMVSKGGTNAFHGDVFEYLRNSTLDAANFFDTPAGSGGHRLPEFRRNNFGGSVGGPIKKDKTFFYGVYEGLRQFQGFTALDNVLASTCKGAAGTVITSAACKQLGSTASVTIPAVVVPILALYPSPNLPNNQFTFPTNSQTRVDYGQMRIDHNFSSSDTVFGRYTIDDAFQTVPSPSGFSADNGVAFPIVRQQATSRNQFVTLSENHIFSPALLNTGRLSYSRTKLDAINVLQQNLSGPQYSFLTGEPVGTINVTGLSANGLSGSYGPPAAYHVQDIYTISDDLYYTRNKHALKFGFLFNRFNQGEQSQFNTTGTLTFSSVATFLAGTASSYSGLTPGSDINKDFIYNTIGFYAQDDWRVKSRLTLNLGLRYEFFTTPWELNGKQDAFHNFLGAKPATPTPGPVMDNPSHLNLSPRLGFAWDVTGKGTTSVRGGFGLYWDVGNLGSAFDQEELTIPPYSSTSSVAFASPTLITLPFSFPAGAAGTALHSMDYNVSSSHLFQYNLSVEHQFPLNIGLAVSYVDTRGIALYNGREGNPAIPYDVVNGFSYWATAQSSAKPAGATSNIIPGTNFTYNCLNVVPSCRINPNWDSAIWTVTGGDSWYNALQVSVTKRLSKGLEFQSSYTWGQALDTTSGQLYSADCSSGGADHGTAPLSPLVDKGPSCFDVTNNWRFNLLYHFPTIGSSGVLSKLVNGWWMGNIVALQSGYAFSPLLATNRSGSGVLGGAPDRVNVNTTATTAAIGGTTYKFIPFNKSAVTIGTVQQWYNPLMFSLAPMVPCPNNAALTCGTLGDAGRDMLRGPGLESWDFSLVKDTAVPYLGEAGSLEFRAEFFNFLNHPNLGMPNSTLFSGATKDIGAFSEVPSATAGQITNTATPSRQIQFALKLIF
jgi:outer membrane receptor protein involved in Fe transport